MSSSATEAPGESRDPLTAGGGRGLRIALWICWTIGLALSMALAWKHAQLSAGEDGGLPGCSGGGFDCDKVLSSPYGKLWGVSLAWFAIAYYVLLAALMTAVARLERSAPALPAALALPAVAAIGLATAGWELGVMIGVIGSICPYCVGVHAANTAFLFLAVAYAQRGWRSAQSARARTGQPPWSVRPALAAGALAALLAGWQMGVLAMFHDPIKPLEVVARDIALSKLRVGGDPAEEDPIWTINGPRDASNTVVVFSCFTCDQCKEAHRLLEELAAEHPGDFRIDFRLNPLAPGCNPLFQGPAAPPHSFACQLAQVALAVALVKPEEFPAFAHWLYEQQARAVPPFEAEDEAARRVGRDALRAALDKASAAGKRIEARMKLDPKLAGEVQLKRVPQIYVGRVGADEPGTRSAGQLSGHITREQLADVLGKQFGWKSQPADGVKPNDAKPDEK